MNSSVKEVDKFTLPELPYALDALYPQISEETMRYHYGKHHQAYVNNLNTLIHNTPYENYSLEEIVLRSEGSIFNNAAQVWNHTFYFEQLSPFPQDVPMGVLAEAIVRDFGSLENLKNEIIRTATALFGSGWVWLACDKRDRLAVLPMQNAGNPLTHGMTPLLAVDVWEHAYYIDYRNRRADSIGALWDRIDWGCIEKRMPKN
ncbi:MAG: superoxide dismutase [Rikenellaceae bacterium]|nr:superoxide dismutase [Rikenellaceae bacterium]